MGLLPAFINLPGGTEWFLLLAILIFVVGAKNASGVISTITSSFRELTGAKRDITKAIEDGVSGAVEDILNPEEEQKKKRRRPRAMLEAPPNPPRKRH